MTLSSLHDLASPISISRHTASSPWMLAENLTWGRSRGRSDLVSAAILRPRIWRPSTLRPRVITYHHHYYYHHHQGDHLRDVRELPGEELELVAEAGVGVVAGEGDAVDRPLDRHSLAHYNTDSGISTFG